MTKRIQSGSTGLYAHLASEFRMKRLPAFMLAIGLAWVGALRANAQAPESIWLAADTTAYKAGETVMITVNGWSATRVQGFTFQIRYDPACLKPVNAASPIPGMNGLSLPQRSGLVDASFASTVPQTINGVLAEVQFVSLARCKTNLLLESAALAIRNASGFAVPLGGIATAQKSVALEIGEAAGGPQPTLPVVGTPLPLEAESAAHPNFILWGIVTLLVMLLVGGGLYALLKSSREG